jgi:hypothetical protein
MGKVDKKLASDAAPRWALAGPAQAKASAAAVAKNLICRFTLISGWCLFFIKHRHRHALPIRYPAFLEALHLAQRLVSSNDTFEVHPA